MGALQSLLCRRELRLLMVGLGSSGKTSINQWWKHRRSAGATTPTQGFNIETFEHGSGSRRQAFAVWDIGGHHTTQMRQGLWRHYTAATDGLVFVVDCCDRERLPTARETLHDILREFAEALSGVALLVLANKQDLPSAVSVAELTGHLGLEELAGQGACGRWHVQPCRANSDAGEGLAEGLDWLCERINSA
ncbi:unnamed protein product [Polarella glacialis]|uniref:ADP-ribosylation factor n=1 Tax=Polarella glacialis TaxID=89957 RepID=A0A813JKD1_POLGL|nr:unnamed protein product [Polarella glacialis]